MVGYKIVVKKPYSRVDRYGSFTGCKLTVITAEGVPHPFRLAEILGTGRKAYVYHAVHLGTPFFDVAIKIQDIEPSTEVGFYHEASILSQVLITYFK